MKRKFVSSSSQEIHVDCLYLKAYFLDEINRCSFLFVRCFLPRLVSLPSSLDLCGCVLQSLGVVVVDLAAGVGGDRVTFGGFQEENRWCVHAIYDRVLNTLPDTLESVVFVCTASLCTLFESMLSCFFLLALGVICGLKRKYSLCVGSGESNKLSRVGPATIFIFLILLELASCGKSYL